MSLDQLLAELLIEVSKGEREVEVFRNTLTEHYNFNVYTVYDKLCSFTGTISSLDIKEFLKLNDVVFTEDCIYLLLRQYDSDNDGRINCSDF